jgi:serine/threonine protein kinase
MNPSADRLDLQEGDDPRLLHAAQEYLAELEAGRRPEHAAFLARFPSLGDQLTPYLDALDMVHGAAPRLHSASERTTGDGALPMEPLGDFHIVREIGRGGMGVVYEAVQLSLGRRVALKVLPFAAALDAKQLQRFQNEAQAAAQLHHTNIVPVFGIGCERGVHYYAMQLIEGQNLAELIRQLRPQRPGDRDPGTRDRQEGAAAPPAAVTAVAAALSTQRASRSAGFSRAVARLGVQAAEALEHAHQLGVIHRDIKPANLIVDGRGTLWVTDFGLAQFRTGAGLTRTGALLGTLRYMSPEQACGPGVALDPRTDVYSLGATLYELLTLEPLFDGHGHHRLLKQIMNDEPRPPRAGDASIPPELETIILKAVSKSPGERYATAQEFADDLRRFLDNRPILARRPTLVQRVRKWARRHPSFVGAAIVLLVLLTAVSLVSAWQIRAAYQRERQRALEADERFQLAKQSVDEMIDISEQELAGNPGMEAPRKRLLEAALGYYGRFIEERRDDPGAQADLARTKERVQKILADLAVLQGAWQLPLLGKPDVLDDLHLSDEQRTKVGELSSRLDKQWKEAGGGFGHVPPEMRPQRFLELARANEAEVREILDPGQLRRLRQIALQFQGTRAFSDPDVVAKVKLTPDQRERIRAIEAETFFCPPGPGPRGPGGPPKGGPEVHEKRMKEANASILALLTPEQVQAWKAMIGEPFTGSVLFRLPFDHPGPPPPP